MHPAKHVLRHDEVHVWTAALCDGFSAEDADILDRDERECAQRFRFELHRRQFLQSHVMMRRVLAGYTGMAAGALTFRHNRNGKPGLALCRGKRPLHFSLSHGGDRCMLAVRAEHPIGIDVEQVRDLPDLLAIARRHFVRAESDALGQLHGVARRDAFFALWTRKEAVVKALGAKLGDCLDRVQFDLEGRLLSLDGDPSHPDRWTIIRLPDTPGYIAAVAGNPGFRKVVRFDWSPAREWPAQGAARRVSLPNAAIDEFVAHRCKAPVVRAMRFVSEQAGVEHG